MKHYIRTKLYFYAEEDYLNKIIESLKENDDPISFNKIIPLNNNSMKDTWGIEEDALEKDFTFIYKKEGLLYQFDTLDNVPIKIYNQLTQMFKEAKIEIEYASDNYGVVCGKLVSEAGLNLLEGIEIDNPLEFACEIWNVDYEEELNEEAINFYEE